MNVTGHYVKWDIRSKGHDIENITQGMSRYVVWYIMLHEALSNGRNVKST